MEKFLDAVCARIRSRAARERVRDELRDHLAEALERGRDLDEVIAELGEPRVLGASFAEVHRPFWLTAPFFGAAACAVTMVTLAGFGHSTRVATERFTREIASTIDTHRERFFVDQRVLAREPAFAMPGKRADAGDFLNPRVKWDTGTQPREPFRFLDRPARIVVPAAVHERLEHTRDWLTLAPEAIDRGIDLGWMNELARYDHWDLFAWAPMAKVMETLGDSPWWTHPIPDFMAVRDAAKLRLLRGLRTGEVLPALREVRQLARLVYSTEILVGSMMSVAILVNERQAYEQAVREGRLRASDWRPVPAEAATRARRAMYGYAEFFYHGVSEADVRKVSSAGFARAGYCAGLQEAAISNLIFRNRVSGASFPLEVDYAPYFDRMERLLSDSEQPCRLTFARAAARQDAAVTAWFEGTDLNWSDWLRWKVAGRIPWVRQWAAIEPWSMWVPNLMSGPYERNRLPGE